MPNFMRKFKKIWDQFDWFRFEIVCHHSSCSVLCKIKSKQRVTNNLKHNILRFDMSYSDADNNFPFIGQRSSDFYAEKLQNKKGLRMIVGLN